MNKPDEWVRVKNVSIGFRRGKPVTLLIDLERHKTNDKAVYSRFNGKLDRL